MCASLGDDTDFLSLFNVLDVKYPPTKKEGIYLPSNIFAYL